MAMSAQERNDAVMQALNHRIRRQILRAMTDHTDGGVSPTQLAERLQLPLSTVSYHTRLLVESGILKAVRTLPRRGAVEHFYRRSGNNLDQKVSKVLELIRKD